MTTLRAYYNDNDRASCAWLRQLINDGLITPGVVDERPIEQVQPNDLVGFDRVHLFAGIAGWEEALRIAGWGSRKVWTGSPPCQPFSSAGKQKGHADARHLWPEFLRLIEGCRPAIVFGEQVASSAVVGPSAKDADMQKMRDREAIRSVLCQLEGQQAASLHGMRSSVGTAAETRKVAEERGAIQTMEAGEARACVNCGRQASGEKTGAAVRPFGGEHSGEDFQRLLRNDGNPVQPLNSTILGRAISRSHRLDEGLHHGQCARGSLCPECDGEYVGAESHCGDRERNYAPAARRFGQLVESLGGKTQGAVRHGWLDGVFADLEAAGYACGAIVLGAHSVGSPNIRQRLYWVGNAKSGRNGTAQVAGSNREGAVEGRVGSFGGSSTLGGLEYAAHAAGARFGQQQHELSRQTGSAGRFWSVFSLIPCRDGKQRRTQPGIFPLAHGVQGRVGLLRGYGNAINAYTAAAFIEAVMAERTAA